MNSEFLKECIRVEVIGRDRKFSWRKAITRTRKNRRKHFLFWWRIACYLYAKGGHKKRLARRIEAKLLRRYDVEIPLTVQIGPGLELAHLSGIMITAHCKIGERLHIKQGATIGIRTRAQDTEIVIGNDVMIGCNASVLGGKITVGDNVTIGAHALVINDVPSDSIYTNQIVPCIRSKGQAL